MNERAKSNDEPARRGKPDSASPRIVSVGTANPPRTYTQGELLALFKVQDPKIRRFFENSHIRQRHLVLPESGPDGVMPDENGTVLLKKHLDTSLEVGGQAVRQCLGARGLSPEDVDALVTVSSTGFLCPSLSAHLVPELGLRRSVQRVDLAGMGCNGGMNGLATCARIAGDRPGRRVLLVASEICSAAYVFDRQVASGVVNSLFGDGAAALLVQADEALSAQDGPQLLGFESYLLNEAIDGMRFDFVDGRFSFFLDRDVPYLIGQHAGRPVEALLKRFGLKKRDVTHWLIHSGGKKVIDSIKYHLGITEHDVRHTRSILRDFGNLSSASFLFSYQRLTQEKTAKKGDWGLTMAMGPGVSIETGLIRW